MLSKNKLLQSKIYHKRFSPKEYDFTHDGFFLYLDLDNLDEISKNRIFSINRINIFSLFFKDYGFEKFTDPKKYIISSLKKNKIDTKKIDKIYLLSMPKILGYSFNPVSFWLCFDNGGNLVISIAEVNNTFGERHSYICQNQKQSEITKKSIIQKEKIFHVSPFYEVKGKYKFRFDVKESKIKIDINYFEDKKLSLATYIDGNLVSLNDLNLAKNLILYPFLTIKVIFLIHYHALRLWLKGIKFFSKPTKPKKDIT